MKRMPDRTILSWCSLCCFMTAVALAVIGGAGVGPEPFTWYALSLELLAAWWLRLCASFMAWDDRMKVAS